MNLRHALCLLVCLATACDGESSSPVDDDAGSAPDGSGGEVDAGGEPEGDAGAPDGGEPDCVVGASAVGAFGPQGGSLSLCGATVSMAAGLLAEERTVRLSVVALPEPAPFPLEAGGLAFDVEVEGGVPAAEMAALSVLLPHAETDHYKYFFRHDATEGYQQIEACITEATSLGQTVNIDGTFVVLIDREAFPTPSEQLGSGSFETTFEAVSTTFDLASDDFDTYGIYDEGGDGSRSVTLAATHTEGENILRAKITFRVPAAGEPEIIEVSYGTLGQGLWGYLPFDTGTSNLTLTTNEGDHLVGSFEVEIRMGDSMMGLLTGSFDATVGLFRYPPSLSCGSLPEG